MVAGYYKNHDTYNKRGTYGRHNTYGRHDTYNKPSAELCGFSTYYNGTSEVTEDFVYRAPLYLNGSRVSNITDSWDGSGKGEWSVWIRNLYLEQNGNSGDRLFEIEDSLGNDRIDLAFITSSHRLGLKVGGGATVYISSITLPLNQFTNIELRFTGADATKQCEIFVDDVSWGSQTIDISLGWSFERFSVGSSSLSTNEYTGLYSGFEIEPLDSWDFVTNQSDGLSVVGSNGKIATIEEATVGETQIKADGTSSTAYVWPDSVKYYMPFTGPLKLREDYVSVTGLTSIDLNTATTRTFLGLIKIDSSISNLDQVLDVGNSASSNGALRILYNNNNIQAFLSRDSDGALIGQTGVLAVAFDEFICYKITVSSSELTLEANGVAATPDTTIGAGTCTVNEIFLATREVAFRNAPVDQYWFSYSDFDTNNLSVLDTTIRLWEQGDVNANKITASNGDVWTLTDASPTGAVAPYIGSAPTAYLISDTACTATSGNPELLLDDNNIGLTDDDGNFLFEVKA